MDQITIINNEQVYAPPRQAPSELDGWKISILMAISFIAGWAWGGV